MLDPGLRGTCLITVRVVDLGPTCLTGDRPSPPMNRIFAVEPRTTLVNPMNSGLDQVRRTTCRTFTATSALKSLRRPAEANFFHRYGTIPLLNYK